MRAIAYRRYGPPSVVALIQMPKPIPRDNEVLIRIRATTVSSGDWRARSLDMPGGFGMLGRPVFGLFGPRQPVLGTECSGAVEAVGPKVLRFRAGDEVFAFTGARFGCHAEYRCIAEDGLIAMKPGNLSFEEAAALSFGGTTALPLLRDNAQIKAGDQVLVIRASGAVGSAAVAIARALGAEVAGVTSTGNVELVRGLGAGRVIDYRKEDFAAGNDEWDVIFDTTGTASFSRCERVLKPGGRLVIVQGSLGDAMGLGRPAKSIGKQVIAALPKIASADIQQLADLAAAGRYKPVVDRVYPLANAAEAHAYVDTGRKRGNVVLTVA